MDDLFVVGFDFSDFGGGSYVINGVFLGIDGLNLVDLVCSMLYIVMEKGNDVKEEIQDIFVLIFVCVVVIVYGQVLSNEEMVSLVDNLFVCFLFNYMLDGCVVLIIIKEEEIDKFFW